MKKYIEINPAEKLKVLKEHTIWTTWKSLDESKWCLHCEKQFTGHSVRVYKRNDSRIWLECGTPGCEGSPLDWADYPWWDRNNPETEAHRKAEDNYLEALNREP